MTQLVTIYTLFHMRLLCLQAQPRLSHEVLKQHTASSNCLTGNAALVEQIQALTATHQSFALQMQALLKVVADQQHRPVVPAGPLYLLQAVILLYMLFGIVLAKLFFV